MNKKIIVGLLLILVLPALVFSMSREEAEQAYESYVQSYTARGGILAPNEAEKEAMIQRLMVGSVPRSVEEIEVEDYQGETVLPFNETHQLISVYELRGDQVLNVYNKTRPISLPEPEIVEEVEETVKWDLTAWVEVGPVLERIEALEAQVDVWPLLTKLQARVKLLELRIKILEATCNA